MKKIIALAVAGAFVAPVMAADVTLSGDFEYVMVFPETGGSSFRGGDQIVTFGASSETSNGLSVSAKANILVNNDQVVGTDGGEHIKVAGPFGTVSLGDVSGGLDNVGDYTDMAPQDGGFGADGSDANILYVLPALVDGLKVSISHAPKDTANNFGNSPAGDSYSVAYNFGAGEVYYGSESLTGSDELGAYGIKYSVAGLTLAAELGNKGTTDYTGIAASYKIGDTTLIVESQEVEANGSTSVDDTLIAVKHSLGGGLSVYAQLTTEDQDATTPNDKTYLGVNYAF
jgi:hypothetical protein